MELDFSFSSELMDVEMKKKKKFDRLWRVGEGGSIDYTLVKEGRVYVCSNDHRLYCVDALTGKKLWEFDTGGITTAGVFVSGNRIYVGNLNGDFFCLDKNGSEVWRFRAGNFFSPPFVEGNLVFVGSKDSYMYALNIHDGSVAWRFKTGDEIACAPIVHKNMLFFGSFDGFFYCLNASSGKELWRFKTGDHIFLCLPPLIHKDVVYFPSFDNHLYGLDVNSGKEVFRFKLGRYGSASTPVIHGNLLLQGTRDGFLYALSLEGKELWRFKTNGIIARGPAVHDDTIYLASEDSNLYAIDLSGNELWRFKAGGAIYDNPKVYNGRIYFGSWDCHLYCLNLEGKELWRFATSTLQQSYIPPAYEAWEADLKIEGRGDYLREEKRDRYSTLVITELDETYGLKSEYAIKSEYSGKREYK